MRGVGGVELADHVPWRGAVRPRNSKSARGPLEPFDVAWVREIEALAPMRFTLITERRRHPPRGRDGGADGACGANLLDGEELPPKATRELAEGALVEVHTPGGGGWGKS